MKLKKTYKYALISSFYVTLLSVSISFLAYYFLSDLHSVFGLLIAVFLLFVTCFFIIQYRAENFIYARIKKIYDDFSLVNRKDFSKKKVTTDIEALSKSVQDYVVGKDIEIENLNVRDSFRRDFLGNVAHELKTPLFTVQGYILTLIEGAVNDKMIRDKYLTRASNGVERLVAVVKDLDMIAKLETDGLKLNKENINVLELIQNVFDLFEMKAKKRNIKLKFDRVYEFPVFVKADVEKIEQVMINLIVNSIKYGKANGTTVVSIDENDTKKITIKIVDDGEGIKKEHLPRLFERFYRVDQSRSRDQGGSGLGLSIVKHIVEAHNQTIKAKSEFGEGATFSFTLERAK